MSEGAAERLDALERELLARADRAHRDLEEIRRARTATTADDEHDPEGSTLSDDWSRTAGLRDAARAGLAEVAAARLRLADGTYGTCTRCGGPVGEGRLAVRPAAARCVSCA
ncbi:TraR/DksA family transcriptional regulator [Cellulomonas endophytica]|uniref:TraR/DksA family transcriptional regulator n=1 Tax=Cellulomonas endophytica TaxID=2494735 RepID=UPI00101106FD|nr:TraR/DksA C4-type zinc finger protein [Cellulomonas endophytica]